MKLKLVRPQPLRFLRRNLAHPATWREHPLRTLAHWRHGFTSEHAALYGLGPSTYADYLPDYLQYRITLATNRNVWPILHDKLLFDAFAAPHLPVSRLLGAATAGAYLRVAHGFDVERWLQELDDGHDFVIKPLQGGGGDDIEFVRGVSAGVATLNGERMHHDALALRFRALAHHGLYRRIAQHPGLAELHPRSTNTLRVHVYRDQVVGARVFGAAVRVGVARSAPVDNFNKGAISVDVDPETGVTGRGVSRGAHGRREEHHVHPETGVALSGLAVPYWAEARAALLAFHERFPAFDLVGWDVAITPDGFVIIEGNHNPQLRTTLVHRSLATDPHFRAFCEARRLLPRPHRRADGGRRPSSIGRV